MIPLIEKTIVGSFEPIRREAGLASFDLHYLNVPSPRFTHAWGPDDEPRLRVRVTEKQCSVSSVFLALRVDQGLSFGLIYSIALLMTIHDHVEPLPDSLQH